MTINENGEMVVTEEMVDLMIELNDALAPALDDDYPDVIDSVLSDFDPELTEEQIEFCLNNYQEFSEIFRK